MCVISLPFGPILFGIAVLSGAVSAVSDHGAVIAEAPRRAERVEPTVTDPVKTWVFFKDKGIDSPAEYAAAIAQVAATYDRRATQRRAMRGHYRRGSGALFDESDLPVARAYIEAVTAGGADLQIVSRWLNAVSVYATRAQVEGIAALPFVKSLRPVGRFRTSDVMDVAEAEPLQRDPRGGSGIEKPAPAYIWGRRAKSQVSPRV